MSRPNPEVDLLVAGAGPAGVATALVAARAGLSVRVVDRATFPRDKTCGDGLTAGALRLLEDLGVGVPDLATTQPVDTVVLVGPDGRQVSLPLPADGHHAVVTTRADLDAALVAHARAGGVEVVEGTTVDAVDADAGGVTVAHGAATTRARFLVAADGHYSTVRRLVAPDDRADLGSWHAFRQYFRGVHDPRLWVLFEADLLPGYVWVFPLPGGRANVGFGVLRNPGTSGKVLAATWRDLLDRPALQSVLGPDAEPEDRHRAWPIPATFDAARLSAGPVLFVGDAAGVVDPMTGEGIAQALETGILAARAVAAGGPTAAVAARYRHGVTRALGRDLRFAATLQRLLRSPARTRGALALVGLTPWTRRNFARWMFEDYPRALLLTPDRWRSGAFTPPGAYRVPT
ncbi:MAG: geranylgeranyl reductase family protein [Actinobacteria bacterium]|nr:geranylgeranyl reductase family protein [Actinomycetota bacterium]